MLFFKRYNYIMLLTFSFVLLVTSGLFYLQYKTQYQHKIQEINSVFQSKINNLDVLRIAKDHIQGMKIKAETYLLAHQEPTQSLLFSQLQPISENEFGLEQVQPPYSKQIVGNLTGQGSLHNRDKNFYRELEMALELNPLFQMASFNIPKLVWAYYTSSNQFINIYPWVSSKDFKFIPALHELDFYVSGLPQNNPEKNTFWTKAYLDQAGKGLMVSCAAPVYEKEQFRGTVALDFTLDILNQFIENFRYAGELFITNKEKQLLAHPTLVNSKNKTILSVEHGFPEEIRPYWQKLFQHPESELIEMGNYLVMYGNLHHTPWQLLLWVPKQAVNNEVINNISWGFFSLPPLLLIVLFIINYVTRYEFINPARHLVKYIENENNGIMTEIPKVPKYWEIWFETVSYIFSENRRLFAKLKNYSLSLEEKVKERVHDIEVKNEALLLLNQEKNEFLGIVAHDLKNPLSAICGLSEIMKDSTEHLSTEEVVEYSQMIFNSSQHMSQLITNLLDVNAIESGKISIRIENIDIVDLLKQLLRNYRKRAERKNISLNLEYIEIQLMIKSDYLLTGQILDNLLSNAIKYSPLGKNVYVRIFKREQMAYCEIEDQGLGLSEEDQQKLFGKFSRLNPKPTADENSTGLGLFIVKKLVTTLGGNVFCRSRLGVGSTFSVAFPLSQVS